MNRFLGLTRLRGMYPGWWVILACGSIGAYGGGVYFYGFTMFFNPLKDELNLTSAQTSLVFALTRMEGAFEGALVGYLIDRFGARRIMMVGVPMAATGFLLWALLVDNYVTFMVVYVGVIAMGINAGFFHPALAVANNWFIRKRATAMAVIGVSQGIGGAILVPLVGYSIATLEWRATAFIAGVFGLVVIWPVTLAVRHSPEQQGLLPDGVEPSGTGGASRLLGGSAGAHGGAIVQTPGLVQEANFSVKEAFRTPVMYLLLAAMSMRFFTHTSIMVHMAPLLEDRGMSPVTAGGAVGVLALATIPSRLASGWFGDRFPKRRVISLLVLFDIAGMMVLLFASSIWQLYLFVVLWASGYGAGLLNWALIGDYFGRTRFATLRGAMGMVFSFAGMAGPLFAGWVHDTRGSYSTAILVFAVCSAIAVVLYWIAQPPKKPAEVVAVAEGQERKQAERA